MTRSEVEDAFIKHADISRADLDFFFDHVEQINLKKNEVLTQAGIDVTHFVLIKSGCLMTSFKDKKDLRHVIQFGTDMWWTGDLEGFLNGKKSEYSIKALIDSEVLILTEDFYNKLVDRSAAFNRYFRIIFQNALISHQKRIIRNISYTGEEKYLEFTKLYPKIEMLAPQKYIASYLGITPEFLSKIRRRLAGKT